VANLKRNKSRGGGHSNMKKARKPGSSHASLEDLAAVLEQPCAPFVAQGSRRASAGALAAA
jgi:hypothetical protein